MANRLIKRAQTWVPVDLPALAVGLARDQQRQNVADDEDDLQATASASFGGLEKRRMTAFSLEKRRLGHWFSRASSGDGYRMQRITSTVPMGTRPWVHPYGTL
eukprot:6201669-Pleurochrysis_carterae.AAC.1